MLDIIYEDNHVIVVIKPQNMPTQSDASGDKDLLSLVKEYVKTKFNKPGEAFVALVHRLDRPTGGIVVFARNSKSASRISAQIQNRSFEKTYFAVLSGVPRMQKGHLVNYLKKDLKENKVKIVPMSESEAKRAELDYEVLETVNELSLVKIKLETGRPHQIRVQLANIGAPVFGDAKYGKIPSNTLNQLKRNSVEENKIQPNNLKTNAELNNKAPEFDLQNSLPVQNNLTSENDENALEKQVLNADIDTQNLNQNIQRTSTTNLALWASELSFKHPTLDKILKFKVYPFEDKSPWNLFNLQKYI